MISFYAASQELYAEVKLTTQELNAEISSWKKADPECKTEYAQSVVLGFGQKDKVPALSADELDSLIDDALNDNYFEWLFNTTKYSNADKRVILFNKRQMVFHAFELAEDEHLRSKARKTCGTINSMEMELV